MFSTRVLVAFAVLAAVAALPADKPVPRPVTTITDEEFDDSPWFSFPLFGNLFAPLWRLFPSFADIGPRIVTDDNKFQVIVNVKDYKKEDLKVKVKGDFIFVQGSHEAKQDDRDVFASQFFHTYSLPANCSGSDVTAELSSDGYLIVSAPLKSTGEKKASADRDVSIVETGTPYQKEEKNVPTTTVQPVSDDRKEPTTLAEREEVTEKDNVIPHGNEIPV
ncbi:alpha-crystallin A chain [Galleria mellonella]|uniref:Alpha-crystallin A chain n=2 Tax=Galleria mellonella TaxID=7137 RepID=A0A3G1T1G8_GALME|nr:alpha-crystallin A chain [Galleria mellonella]AXY94831.1 small heat shock protein [Galleria mellonella]